MFHISKCAQENQRKIIGRTFLESEGDKENFTSDFIGADVGSLQGSNEAFMAKM